MRKWLLWMQWSRDLITENGCKSCNSALVDNDNLFTIQKCIIKEGFNCTGDYFWNLVPENLKSHPLRGKTVCRKCHKECDSCFANGAALKQQCYMCKNLHSNSTNECVSNCSSHNEYLQTGTKVFAFTDNVVYFNSYLFIISLNLNNLFFN